VIEKGADVGGAEVAGMGGVVEPDEPPDPAHIGVLGMDAVAAAPAHRSDAVEEFGRAVGHGIRLQFPCMRGTL
jgi:hypothetical protein